MSLQKVQTAAALNDVLQGWRDENLSISFVPTMGALHDGHLSLVTLAQEKADRVVVSIFVNPAQFGPQEDFKSYPRDIDSDLQKLESCGVQLVYLPQEKDIYPEGQDSGIKAGPAAKGLETEFRPHFFDGVVNVVHRLFLQVRPDSAVFGEKDYQQLRVIEEMVASQEMDIEIISGAIMRDEQGLALSSRNAYLSSNELIIAQQLNKILSVAAESRDTDSAKAQLLNAGFDKIDYVSIRGSRILAAVWIGKTRLIDNMVVAL